MQVVISRVYTYLYFCNKYNVCIASVWWRGEGGGSRNINLDLFVPIFWYECDNTFLLRAWGEGGGGSNITHGGPTQRLTEKKPSYRFN